ncbi:OmpH family outer membrane protein [Altererythrobacter salegens]|uniref:OmpH family outer membrane protein n=2 Tax=Croceibacterium salegens TaxID=1737568 RepID=A0A6I4SV91_9SPHN|nr:OmpH family outer membrane protein [Croceibacterium salegens]
MLSKPALAAGLALATLASPAAVSPAAAQQVAGIGIVNAPLVIANSNAFKTAQQQRQVTYKAQIDQATARRQAIATQLQPMVAKLQADSQAANAAQNQASLQQQYNTIQQIQQSGQQELQEILAPVSLSQAYVEEQITDQLATAVQNAATKKNVTLVIGPDSVLYAAAPYNLNQAVLDELNTLIPSAQIVPPQGWLPREMREQQAQQQAAAQGQQPAAAATAPVSGR